MQDIDRDGLLYMVALLNYYNRKAGTVYVALPRLPTTLGFPRAAMD
ncbi:hypothetical protein ACQP1W_32270 [Spirillospora sp. CA-255316]